MTHRQTNNFKVFPRRSWKFFRYEVCYHPYQCFLQRETSLIIFSLLSCSVHTKDVLNCSEMENMQNIKCVVIGSKSVGKTSLLNSYVTSPRSSVIPFESYNGIKVQIEENSEIFQLELWDTNCASYNKTMRRKCYEDCSVVLICFSVMDHESFKDVRKKWIPELRSCRPTTHIVLIGTKNDLRQDKVSLLRLDRLQNLKPIKVEEGIKMAKRLSAVKYLECSAFSGVIKTDLNL